MVFRRCLLALAVATVASPNLYAQGAQVSAAGNDPRAQELIQAAVKSELAAAQTDHSTWTYRDHDKTADKDAVYEEVDTPQGGLRRMTELDGRPVDPATKDKETTRISTFVHDPDAQAKQRKSGAHDDEQASKMLQMLPRAYIWRLKSETPEQATLTFAPDPAFHAPDIESRVMATMAGDLIIAKPDHRIRTLRGELTDDVKIGFGILGKLRKGGTFDVERREIAPHLWQITETRVHIDGHALLFKTIGQQEDEIKSDWKPSTALTLEAAAKQLGAN